MWKREADEAKEKARLEKQELKPADEKSIEPKQKRAKTEDQPNPEKANYKQPADAEMEEGELQE